MIQFVDRAFLRTLSSIEPSSNISFYFHSSDFIRRRNKKKKEGKREKERERCHRLVEETANFNPTIFWRRPKVPLFLSWHWSHGTNKESGEEKEATAFRSGDVICTRGASRVSVVQTTDKHARCFVIAMWQKPSHSVYLRNDKPPNRCCDPSRHSFAKFSFSSSGRKAFEESFEQALSNKRGRNLDTSMTLRILLNYFAWIFADFLFKFR